MDSIATSFNAEFDEMMIYLDPNHRFAYTEFMNNADRQTLCISSSAQTVIIIDMQTRYFNASKLYSSLATNGYTLAHYIKSKSFTLACEEIDKLLNVSSHPLSSSSPSNASSSSGDELNDASDSEDSIDYLFDEPKQQQQSRAPTARPDHPIYTIDKTKTNELWSGLYMHPYLLSHLLISINPIYGFKLSEFIFDFHIRQSANRSLTLSKLINNNKFNAVNDLCEYNEISNIIHDLNMPTTATADDILSKSNEEVKELITTNEKFDLVQYLKTQQYARDYKKMISGSSSLAMKRIGATLSTSSDQTLLVIAHYDTRGQYAYGSKAYKLTFDIINTEDLPQYMALFNKPNKSSKLTEAEYEEMIFSDKIRIKTNILIKFVSLHDLPPDIMSKFTSDYDCEVNMYTELIDHTEYLIVNEIDKFKSALSDFLLPYMKL